MSVARVIRLPTPDDRDQPGAIVDVFVPAAMLSAPVLDTVRIQAPDGWWIANSRDVFQSFDPFRPERDIYSGRVYTLRQKPRDS